ncbi:UbiA family prenyltransferase [Grimontia kaedaensis]|uniref:UbiA family prenyltransferase n=1 Tax=Grimontia kaedaensis TaxID=2872157 RepID=A0ABY4WWP4_9GAMM|nr:UbiA family prenyltransferase [Grimontia kaedaensis]USH03508.1 UbiA family prenyltransferase [Grimontia kaedaensis]
MQFQKKSLIPKPTLVVDLDGTLLRSDILYETFWNAVGKNWRNAFLAVQALMQGKAALKRCLVSHSDIDSKTLPYNEDVIGYVKEWRTKGGRTALVTASDETVARKIAEHLDIFDETYGSNGVTNLKGEEKARFLTENYKDSGYVYVGDAEADIPVWQSASHTITVNASESLKRKAQSIDQNAEHLSPSSSKISSYLRALRPHQWLKNVLIFLPMLLAHQFDAVTLTASLLAFITFSLLASGVYVLNDLVDLASDRAHPRKCKRPFASGEIPIAHGTWMVSGLLIASFLMSLTLSPLFLAVLIGYFLTTSLYSFLLKQKPIVDICLLAGLYSIRLVAGSAATGIELSVWLLAFSTFFFLSLATVKRQAELVDSAERGLLEAKGRGYRVSDLSLVSQIAISSGYVSVLVMALYVNSPSVADLYNFPAALWGICLVLLYWVSRMVWVTSRGKMHDDPIVYAVKDQMSRLCFLLIAAFAFLGAAI